MAAEELVERVLAGDVDRQAAAAAAGPAPHLPQAGHRAGERDADRRVELADVDPQLERVGRHHAEQLAGRQPALDLLALGRRVAGAVGRDPLGELRLEPVHGVARISSTPLRDFMKQIVRAPLVTSSENTSAASYSAEPRTPSSSSSSGGFHIATRRWRLRRGVAVDEVEVGQAGEALGQLDRVGDRRAGEQEPRLGAVDRRGPAQPPQHVADVRAEHAPVDVRLVDDHEGQVGEQVAPGGVVGQDPDVQHVGVGEDQVAALADRRALGARRVAVVDRRPDLLVQPEAVQRARLVLGQRLGRVEVQRARGAVGGQDLERRELEAERLPRRRAGGDDRRPVEGLAQRLAPGARRAARSRRWSSACGDAPARARRGSRRCARGAPRRRRRGRGARPRGRCASSASQGSVSRTAATSRLSMAAVPASATAVACAASRRVLRSPADALPLRRSRRDPARARRLAAARRRRRLQPARRARAGGLLRAPTSRSSSTRAAGSRACSRRRG